MTKTERVSAELITRVVKPVPQNDREFDNAVIIGGIHNFNTPWNNKLHRCYYLLMTIYTFFHLTRPLDPLDHDKS